MGAELDVDVHVNGKWLSQPVTGTQRYATEICRVMVAQSSVRFIVHVPATAEVPEWLRTENVDVRRAPFNGVVFEQFFLPMATYGKILLNFAGPAPLFKRKQLVTMHDALTFRFPQSYRKSFVALYLVMYFLLSRTAKGVATVSHFSAAELAAVLKVSADRFIVTGCAADELPKVDAVRPAIAPDEPYYLMVGTQAAHKNLAAPVEAVTKSGRLVVVVGVSDQNVFLNNSLTDSYQGRALIAGRLADAELVWLYRNARALIFPSKYEGFGLPVLEAQALACPVLCSTAASLPEVAGDGACFFDPDEPESLLLELERFERTTGLAEELRRRGLANSGRYSWCASAWKVLDWLLSGRTGTVRRRGDRID